MLIDILFLAMMAMAIFNGVRNGLIAAIFSIVGWVLGLIAAFKFSGWAASRLEGVINVSERMLSIISFVLVFAVVILVVTLTAKLVEKTFQLALLGWVNRIGGIFFYVLLYTLIFSVIVYFGERVNLAKDAIESSRVYPWVKPLAEIVLKPFLD